MLVDNSNLFVPILLEIKSHRIYLSHELESPSSEVSFANDQRMKLAKQSFKSLQIAVLLLSPIALEIMRQINLKTWDK